MYDHPFDAMPDQSAPSDCDTEAPPSRLNRRLLLGGMAGAIAAGWLGPPEVEARTVAEARIEKIINKMRIADKAAQMFAIGAAGSSMTGSFEAVLDELQPGGVLFTAANVGSARQLKDFVKLIHRSNAALPPLVSIDQEGGPVSRIPGDPAPGAVELGKASSKVIRQKAKQRAEFLGGFGFDVNFAPVADVAYRPTSYRASRSFGSDPGTVADNVHDVIRGSLSGGLAGAAKHSPGHGRTNLDSHLALPEVRLSLHGWKKTDSRPFAAAIDAGVEMVMIGHLNYPKWDDLPTSLSRVAVKTLREELHFKGVVVTDDLGMGALRGIDPYEVVDRAIHAGVDLLLYASYPVPVADLIRHLRQRISRGDVSEKRIDASLRRILLMKSRRFDLRVP
jgi:beta-N-acetylhexosaminidase